jgi:hypothetical protein
MKDVFKCMILLMFYQSAYAYDSRIAIGDTIPDTVASITPVTGLKSSGLSVATGLGAGAVNIFNFIKIANGTFEDVPLVFALGGIIGLVGIISGIISLSRNRERAKMKSVDAEEIRKTKNRSIAGIVLGVLSVTASVFLILMDAGVMGW